MKEIYLVPVGTQKQLFVDNEIIEDTWGLNKSFHKAEKFLEKPVMVPEMPWEGQGLSRPIVLREDNGLFRMWYSARAPRDSSDKSYVGGSIGIGCYAESEDGYNWRRPELRLHSFRKSLNNNIYLVSKGTLESSYIFKDDHESDKRYSYKMLWQTKSFGEPITARNSIVPDELSRFDIDGLRLVSSMDGLHWDPNTQISVFPGNHDTSFLIVRDEGRKRWLLITRAVAYAGHWKRRIAVSVSDNLKEWSLPRNVLIPDNHISPEIYGMPSFAYSGIFFGFPQIFHSAESSTNDSFFAYSRNGIDWNWPVERKPFLERGLLGEFDSHWLSVEAPPVQVGEELWFYYTGSNRRHDDISDKPRLLLCIGIAKLRIDGFVSLDCTDARYMSLINHTIREDELLMKEISPIKYIYTEKGVMLTRPFICEGEQLVINGWAPNGTIKVEIIDMNTPLHQPEPGPGHEEPFADFKIKDCIPFHGDSTHYTFSWKCGDSLRKLLGHPIRLKFEIENGRLYSFQLKKPVPS